MYLCLLTFVFILQIQYNVCVNFNSYMNINTIVDAQCTLDCSRTSLDCSNMADDWSLLQVCQSSLLQKGRDYSEGSLPRFKLSLFCVCVLCVFTTSSSENFIISAVSQKSHLPFGFNR